MRWEHREPIGIGRSLIASDRSVLLALKLNEGPELPDLNITDEQRPDSRF